MLMAMTLSTQTTMVLVPSNHQKSRTYTYIFQKPLRTIHINTNYPITHFIINLLGIMNIIKGSGVQIPLVPSFIIKIEPEINWTRIATGLGLLLASRILRAQEAEREEEA